MKIADITRNQPQPLNEMPMVGYHTLGNFDKNSSYKKPADRKILTNPIHVQRAKNAWSKTNHDFNMFFVNNPEGIKYQEMGVVSPEWLNEKMPRTMEAITNAGGFKNTAINVIYTNNSGAEWQPMTPWIMAHRLAHAIVRGNGMYGKGVHPVQYIMGRLFEVFGDLMKEVYGVKLGGGTYSRTSFNNLDSASEKALTAFLHGIGTFKSARDGNMRNHFEWFFECFAQYLLMGEIKFNPMPRAIKVGRGYYPMRASEHDQEFYNTQIEHLADELADEFEQMLNAATGHILVM